MGMIWYSPALIGFPTRFPNCKRLIYFYAFLFTTETLDARKVDWYKDLSANPMPPCFKPPNFRRVQPVQMVVGSLSD
jgi:hypothetical protein